MIQNCHRHSEKLPHCQPSGTWPSANRSTVTQWKGCGELPSKSERENASQSFWFHAKLSDFQSIWELNDLCWRQPQKNCSQKTIFCTFLYWVKMLSITSFKFINDSSPDSVNMQWTIFSTFPYWVKLLFINLNEVIYKYAARDDLCWGQPKRARIQQTIFWTIPLLNEVIYKLIRQILAISVNMPNLQQLFNYSIQPSRLFSLDRITIFQYNKVLLHVPSLLRVKSL